MRAKLHDVQRIVLRGGQGDGQPWGTAQHWLVSFRDGAPLHLLATLQQQVSGAGQREAAFQCSIGFTRRGLERLHVPRHVLGALALKAPAFWSGPALRAAGRLGLCGDSAPEHWEGAFAPGSLHMVLSLHAKDGQALEAGRRALASPRWCGMDVFELEARSLLPPPGEARDPLAQWVHFGYRDGLSRIGIAGWTTHDAERPLRPSSWHAPGEFVVGHPTDTGADPWVAGPGPRVWAEPLRAFFRNGSFGVLHQMAQHVDRFEAFVEEAAARTWDGSAAGFPGEDERKREVKGKLCGRYPDGKPLALGAEADPLADFGYEQDPLGAGCPFGSHARRMNPRLPRSDAPAAGVTAAHSSRARPLLRRGLPYGSAIWDTKAPPDGPERGLMGHFFCARIEDQYEHLLGEWGDRMPLGSSESAGGRDPFIGLHDPRDPPFEIPAPPARPLRLPGFTDAQSFAPFVRTKGIAYLFYPSLTTLARMADSDLWQESEDRP